MGQAGARRLQRRSEERESSKSWAEGPVFAHSRRATFAVRETLSMEGRVSFRTEDNGGDAFLVELMGAEDVRVRVRDVHGSEGAEALELRADEVWLGQGEYDDADLDVHIGCAVLCVVPVDGGSELLLFSTDARSLGSLGERERVEELVATLCNSGVVYGYIRTNLRIIFPAPINCCFDRGSKEYRLDARRWDAYVDKSCVLGDEEEYLHDVRGDRVFAWGGRESGDHRSQFVDTPNTTPSHASEA